MIPAEIRVHIRRIVVDAPVAASGGKWGVRAVERGVREALGGGGELGGSGSRSAQMGVWDGVAGQIAGAVAAHRSTSSGSDYGGR